MSTPSQSRTKTIQDAPDVAPATPGEFWTGNLNAVRQAEFVEIRQRRNCVRRQLKETTGAVDPNDCSLNVSGEPTAPLDDIVGVALSGGGIRAAALSIGVLHSLHETGVIKFVDYLSTVSGGGYAGSAYSAAAQTSGKLDEIFPTPAVTNRTTQGYAGVLRRIIYGGEYLYRPWEAANKYLVGLFFNNLLLLSGIVTACTIIVLAWRSLDYQIVREALGLVYLDSDVYVALLPFSVFLLFWIIAWLLSYLVRGGDAPGKWAQRWLYLTVASFLIGTTLLLVSGETTLGASSLFFGDGEKASNTGTLSKWLLATILAGLTPLLAPGRLLQMGFAPRGMFDRAVFRIALVAFCVGVPLIVIGIIGQQNISQTRDDPDDNIRLGDIRNWPAFCSTLGTGPALSEVEQGRLEELQKQAVGKEPSNGPELASLYRKQLAGQIPKFQEQLFDLYEAKDGIAKQSLPQRLKSVIAAPFRDNEVRKLWDLKRKINFEKQNVLDKFNEYVLPSWHLPLAIIKEKPLIAEVEAAYTREKAAAPASPDRTRARPGPPPAESPSFLEIEKFLKESTGDDKISDEALREDIADARLSYASVWRERGDGKAFNLTLLGSLHPECFYAPNRIYRFNVTTGDQQTRLWILLFASLAFVAGLFVDLNSTALHRFYRNRLAYAYLTPFRPASKKNTDKSAFDIELKELRNTKCGAPYHILNTTVNLRYKTNLEQANEGYLGAEGDQPMEQVFMYSKLYCGCQMTGWMKTGEYQLRSGQVVSLANAMALSGAAVSAQMCKSAPERLLMIALNLNLGQWVPNPKNPSKGSRAWPLRLVFDWTRRPAENARFCFVSDGGFTDNLGIFTLLRRRCRLILAFDAGSDAKHQFEDLGRIVRAARVHLGIHIVARNTRGEEVDIETILVHPDERGMCKEHFIVAKVFYPANGDQPETSGWLVYMKSSLTGDESVDILGYRSRIVNFPHETTADQFYDSARMETYRQLGLHIGRMTLNKLFPQTHRTGTVLSVALLDENSMLGAQITNEEHMLDRATKAVASLEAMQVRLGDLAALRPIFKWQSALEELRAAITEEHGVPVDLRPGAPVVSRPPVEDVTLQVVEADKAELTMPPIPKPTPGDPSVDGNDRGVDDKTGLNKGPE